MYITTTDSFNLIDALWEPYYKKSNPPSNVQETDDSFIFSMDIPGVKKELVDVTCSSGALVVSGTRNNKAFSRSVRLPKNVDLIAAAASMEDGVLTVTLPKKQESLPRKILIK